MFKWVKNFKNKNKLSLKKMQPSQKKLSEFGQTYLPLKF